MATILDIAKKAGVSHGTVSNVLNKKGNVSIEKIKKVEAAAAALGYQMNNKAKSLRSGTSKNIGIIIPSYEQEEYFNLYIGLERQLTKNGFIPQVYVTEDNPYVEKEIIAKLSQEKAIAVISVSCLKNAAWYYETLAIPNDKIIFINRKPKNATHYVSFNFEQAGIDIGTLIMEENYKKVGIILSDEGHFNQQSFINALATLVDSTLLHVFPTNRQNLHRMLYKIAREQHCDCFITNSKEKARLLQKAFYYSLNQASPPILTLSLDNNRLEQEIQTYQLNYYAMGLDFGQKLADAFKKNITINKKNIYENDGFEMEGISKKEGNKTLKVLSLHSPSTEALSYILPNFQAETNIDVQLDSKSYEEISDILHTEKYKEYDLIRMDMALFPWYATKIFRPISGQNPYLDQILASFSDKFHKYYSELKGKSYMFPFDPSVQMMFYRKDLFENQLVKRMFFKHAKRELSPPKTFEELVEIARFFYEHEHEIGDVSFGISLNVHNPTIIAAEFLSCYYSLGAHFIIQDNQIQLDLKKGKKALEIYYQLLQYAKKDTGNWWKPSIQSFIHKETAIVIGFVNHLSAISQSEIVKDIAYTNIPGSQPLLGGGVFGLVNQSTQTEEAFQFLLWIHQRAIAKEITNLGGLSSNRSINKSKEVHYDFPWLRHLDSIIGTGIRESKTDEGDPVNILAVEKIIGLTIKQHLTCLDQTEKILKRINHNLKQSSSMMVHSS